VFWCLLQAQYVIVVLKQRKHHIDLKTVQPYKNGCWFLYRNVCSHGYVFSASTRHDRITPSQTCLREKSPNKSQSFNIVSLRSKQVRPS